MEVQKKSFPGSRTRLEPLPPLPWEPVFPPGPHFHFTTLLSNMTLHFEVISRFQAAASADALLYTPLTPASLSAAAAFTP